MTHAEDDLHAAPVRRRYEVHELLGRGGQGLVYRARDLKLHRDVALKTLHAGLGDAATERFIEEARSTARLEHPNVTPVHDLGELDDGRPFYTMRLVSERTLANILDACEEGGEDALREWTLIRRVQLVQGVCRALERAHDEGVLHRDVKPANVLVGPGGEVLLTDWGISKDDASRTATTTGVVRGTLAYMSPEQARAEKLDARADVYSTGVLLYECLCLQPPFTHDNPADMFAALLRDPAPHVQDMAGPGVVPDDLADVAMRAIAKDAADRIPSARSLHDELQSFVEGVRDRERRRAEADDLCAQGDADLRRHAEAVAERSRLEEDVARLEREHPQWEPIDRKRPLIDATRRLEDAADRCQELFLQAVNRYTDALAHLPDHPAARAALADVFLERFREAEHDDDRRLARTFEVLTRRFHDGRHARMLKGDGALEIRVHPESAELVLHPQVEDGLVLVDGPGQRLGRGDVALSDVPMGSYVIVATAPGHHSARYPVLVERCATSRGELRLMEEGSLPAGFVHVPGASAWLGGDERASNAEPLRRVSVSSFAMKAHPVTFGEYCAFLDALAERGADPRPHWPRTEVEGPLVRLEDGRHVFAVPLNDDFRRNFPEAGWRDVPVSGVCYPDARRYLAWLGEQLDRELDLPSGEEWEYAARGADRRPFPWGSRHDAALAHLATSLPDAVEIGPVGAFVHDVSPFGVRDMAGCIQEWTRTLGRHGETHEVRGGSWQSGPVTSRACWRGAASPSTRNPSLGFRGRFTCGS